MCINLTPNSSRTQSLYTQSQATFGTYVTAGTLVNNYAHVFDLLIRLRQVCTSRIGVLGLFYRALILARSNDKHVVMTVAYPRLSITLTWLSTQVPLQTISMKGKQPEVLTPSLTEVLTPSLL